MGEIALVPEPLPIGSVDHRASGWWAMLGVVLTEAALFAYLLFGYFYFAIQPHTAAWPPGGHPKLTLSLAATAVLVLSSVAVLFGERATAEPRRRGRGAIPQVLWLLAGFLLGVGFVVLQAFDWRSKPFSISSDPYGSLYFLITGVHLAHIFVGLLMLLALIVWSALGYFGRWRNVPVAAGAVYWHFVVIAGIMVFLALDVTPYLG